MNEAVEEVIQSISDSYVTVSKEMLKAFAHNDPHLADEICNAAIEAFGVRLSNCTSMRESLKKKLQNISHGSTAT